MAYCLSLLDRAGRCQALSDLSVGLAVKSIAGSTLLFGIGTEALP